MSNTKHVNAFTLKAFESVPDLYLILSPTLHILTASDTFLATTYTERSKIVGRYLFDVFPDNPENDNVESVNSLKDSLKQVIASKTPQSLSLQRYDMPMPKSLGGGFVIKYWNALNTPVFDEDEDLLYIIHKVTAYAGDNEQNQGYQQLEVSEQSSLIDADWKRKKLRNIFTQAPIAIAIYSGKDFVVELMNDKMCSILEVDAEKVVGKKAFHIPNANISWLKKTLMEVFETGKAQKLQEVCVSCNGHHSKNYFNAKFKPIFGLNDNITGIINIVSDITEQVLARQKAENSERQLRLVTDALPVLIAYLDLEEKYRFANKAYEDWFPISADEMIGKYVWEVIGSKAYKNVRQYIEQAKSGELVNFEVEMPYRKDFVKYIQTSYVPDVQHGKTIGFFTLVTDITEQVHTRKRLITGEKEAQALANKLAVVNEELRAASEELVSRNEELGSSNLQLNHINADMDNFIYTASHDLKAPISNIEGLMFVLHKSISEQSRSDPQFIKIADLINKSIARFKSTLADLAEITRLQRTDGEEEESYIDLADIISEVHLDLATQIEESNATIHLGLNECGAIKFSKKNARSIVYNLLSNAIKYRSPDRLPEVVVHCHTTNDYIVLSVKDNGLGMNMAEKDKIFAMFKRLHDHVDGTGIGLYIVKKIVESTGGKIEVDSELGKGSSFNVFFKIDRSQKN